MTHAPFFARLTLAASAALAACGSSAQLPLSGSEGKDAAAPPTPTSTPTAAPTSTPPLLSSDGGDLSADAAPPTACTPLPGCTSGASCPAGESCGTCTCETATWFCQVLSCTDAGADAGTSSGLCPVAEPSPGDACAAPSDVVCAYATKCPVDAFRCTSGIWALIPSGAGICPPPHP